MFNSSRLGNVRLDKKNEIHQILMRIFCNLTAEFIQFFIFFSGIFCEVTYIEK